MKGILGSGGGGGRDLAVTRSLLFLIEYNPHFGVFEIRFLFESFKISIKFFRFLRCLFGMKIVATKENEKK